MARCPKCKENWFWDWDQDYYIYIDGSDIEFFEFLCTEPGMEIEIIVFKCKCGSINSVMYNDENRGSSLCNIKEWSSVDWEMEGHAWENHCKNCKNLKCLDNFEECGV